MLCPPLTPLNRRPNVPNLPDPHRARPGAQRVRSPATSGLIDASRLTSELGWRRQIMGNVWRSFEARLSFSTAFKPVSPERLPHQHHDWETRSTLQKNAWR